jgi:hypothetical protein
MPLPSLPRESRPAVGGEIRCGCGSLLARVLPDGVELKCRRCGRLIFVGVDDDGQFYVSQSPDPRQESAKGKDR